VLNKLNLTTPTNTTGFGSFLSLNGNANTLAVRSNEKIFLYKYASLTYQLIQTTVTYENKSPDPYTQRLKLSTDGSSLVSVYGTEKAVVLEFETSGILKNQYEIVSSTSHTTGYFADGNFVYLSGILGSVLVYNKDSSLSIYNYVKKIGTDKTGPTAALYVNDTNTRLVISNPNASGLATGAIEVYQ
jgi:hypothetical protein